MSLSGGWEIEQEICEEERKFFFLKMAPVSKADKKVAVDAAAWMFNVVTSVGIIIVNKALMATYGYSFGNYHLPF